MSHLPKEIYIHEIFSYSFLSKKGERLFLSQKIFLNILQHKVNELNNEVGHLCKQLYVP